MNPASGSDRANGGSSTSPLVRYGLWFCAFYAVGWWMVLPPFDRWRVARARAAQAAVEVAQLRELVAAGAGSAASGAGVGPEDAVADVEEVVRASGWTYERLDPQARGKDKGDRAFAVQGSGRFDQLVALLELGARRTPRLVVRTVRLRSTDQGVRGELGVVVRDPRAVRSAKRVAVRGRDPFHYPPPPQAAIPVPQFNDPLPPPPPPPEPVIRLSLYGLNDGAGLLKPEALMLRVINGIPQTLQRVHPDSFPGVQLEFDVPRGLIRIKREGHVVREWRQGEGVEEKLLKGNAEGPPGLPLP